MFGWLTKILERMVAKEAYLLEKRLVEKLNAEGYAGTAGGSTTELRAEIKDELRAELKDEIQQELREETNAKLQELFAGFKHEMAARFDSEVTGEFKRQIAEELHQEFPSLLEQIIVSVKNNLPAGQPAFLLSQEFSAPETLLNIGPGLKQMLSDNNSAVKKETIMQFFNSAAAKIDPARSWSLADLIMQNGQTEK